MIALIVVICLAVLLVATNIKQSLLFIQKATGGPGDSIQIGNALVKKPKDWLLSSSRQTEGADAKLFGFISEKWLPKKIDLPDGVYFLFVETARGGTNSTIFLAEMPKAEALKTDKVISSHVDNKFFLDNERWIELSNFYGSAALISMPLNQGNQGRFIVKLPKFRLTMHLPSLDIIGDITVESIR